MIKIALTGYFLVITIMYNILTQWLSQKEIKNREAMYGYSRERAIDSPGHYQCVFPASQTHTEFHLDPVKPPRADCADLDFFDLSRNFIPDGFPAISARNCWDFFTLVDALYSGGNF